MKTAIRLWTSVAAAVVISGCNASISTSSTDVCVEPPTRGNDFTSLVWGSCSADAAQKDLDRDDCKDTITWQDCAHYTRTRVCPGGVTLDETIEVTKNGIVSLVDYRTPACTATLTNQRW